jgi:hypothetical protein
LSVAWGGAAADAEAMQVHSTASPNRALMALVFIQDECNK